MSPDSKSLPFEGRLALLSLGLFLAPGCHDSNRGRRQEGGDQEPLFVDFALRTDLHLGSAFLGDLLHVDLDQDGTEDLVESNFGTRFLTLAQGHLDGSFTTLFELPTIGHAFRLASGDFDGDGRRDVALTCGDWIDGAPRGVQVFLQGPAPFEFGASVTLALDSDPKDLCAAPLSGQGGTGGPDELFVAMRDQQRVLRLVLAGGALVENGELESSAVGRGSPLSVATIDLGGDGLLDLAVGEDNPGLDRVLVYRRGALGFGPAELVLQPAATPIVDNTLDMDGNGFEDLAVAQLDGDEVVLLAGDASGLAQAFALDFGGETTSLLFADVSGDGLADAVATVFLQESVQVRLATAPFVWGAPVHYNVGVGPRAIGVVALPGDANADLLCGNAQDLSILFGTGAGRFRAATGVPTGPEQPIFVDTADLDGDGDRDAVAITREQQTLVFCDNVGGTLRTAQVLDLNPTKKDDSGYLALGDVDQDGDVDVVATILEKGEVRIYRNQGGPASFTQPSPLDVVALGAGPLGVALADVNGDGRPDLVVGNLEAASLHVLLGQGGGAFAALPPLTLDFAPLQVACEDLDGDGRVDLAASTRAEGGEGVALFAGDGAGHFALRRTFAFGSTVGSLALGDVDEDGRVDLVLGGVDLLAREALMLVNRGGFDFLSESLSLADGPGTPLLADTDRDGHLDLDILTTGGELVLARGDGHGSFTSLSRRRDEMPCPEPTVSGALADLDGDRLPELLMVSPESPFLWVARNLSRELPQP